MALTQTIQYYAPQLNTTTMYKQRIAGRKIACCEPLVVIPILDLCAGSYRMAQNKCRNSNWKYLQ